VRMRPIILTSLTTIFGLAPMAFGRGVLALPHCSSSPWCPPITPSFRISDTLSDTEDDERQKP
jgi:hypothetical protein